MYVDKKHEDIYADRNLNHRVLDLLAKSEEAIREGDSKRAHQLSLEATQIAPESIDAWLLRATLAPTLEERVHCVNHLNELAPGYQDRYNVAFFALKDLLDRKPFLAYLEETDDLYRVLNADRVVLSIPKKRAAGNSPPPEHPPVTPLRPAYRWLILSIVGLLLAGIGTVIFAPLAALAAVRVNQASRTRAEQMSSAVILIVSVILFMIGVVFSLLFLLHWSGR